MSDVLVLVTVKEMIEISHTAQDTILQVFMDGLESEVETFLGYKFASAARTDHLDGGGYGLWPTSRLIVSVTSVTDNISGTVIGSGDYRIVDDVLYLDSGARWDEGPTGRWTVIYVGGWTSVTRPKKIDVALYDLIYRKYHNRGGKGMQSSSGYSVDWDGADSDVAKRLRQLRHGGAVIG